MQSDQFPFSKEYAWESRQKIGQGGFGAVFRVMHRKKNSQVAIKQIDMSKFDQDFKIEALKSEIKAMKELSSTNTVSMFEYSMGGKYTYMILELCQSDLQKELEKRGGNFGEDESIHALDEILMGFKVLIEKGYIHRDVKPQNILVHGNTYKIADYGFSKKVKKIDKQKLIEVCGSPLYMSPQLLFNQEYTSKSDIWSLGLMFYEMIFGFSPWSTRHFEVYKRGVVNKPVAFPYNCRIGANVEDFLLKCLQVQEEKRISWKELFKHPLVVDLNKGPPIEHIQVGKDLEIILMRVQESSSRKFINVEELFKRYGEKYKNMKKEVFFSFIREIDPEITTYEAIKIFEAADRSKDGEVSLEEFKHFYLDVDYRPMNDIASRRIEEISKMAQARNLNIRQFFDLFDKDKSSSIDTKEFYQFIRYIAPAISDFQINLMWKRFDSDSSGAISMDEFVAELSRSVPGQGSRISKNYEQVKRNIKCLHDFMWENKISTGSLFEAVKLKPNQSMKIGEFAFIMKKIKYSISEMEIQLMLQYIDRNGSGTIEFKELQETLGL